MHNAHWYMKNGLDPIRRVNQIMDNLLMTSPWCDYRDNNSNTLLVTFSYRLVPKGKFAPYKAVNNLPYDILRFNCPNDIWYRNDYLADQPLEQLISDFIKTKRRYARVAFYGDSMGAFAALDYGLRCNADTIISCGAETIFGIKGGYAKDAVDKVTVYKMRKRIKEWPEVFNREKTRVFALFSGEVLVDMLFGLRLERLLGMPAHFLKCGHSVAKYIKKGYNVSTYIENLIERGGDPFLEAESLSINKRDLKKVCIEHYRTIHSEYKSKKFSLHTNCVWSRYQYVRMLVDQKRIKEARQELSGFESECANRSGHFYLKYKLLPQGSVEAFDYVRTQYETDPHNLGICLRYIEDLIDHKFTADAVRLLARIETGELEAWAKKWVSRIKSKLQ